MARPAKPRFVADKPCVDFFKPRGIPLSELEQEKLSIEELEAIRLVDLVGLYQEEAAERMEISRGTFQRVLKSGRGKVARCLVEGKALGIEGGNYLLGGGLKALRCLSCGHTWEESLSCGFRACEMTCPECGQMSVRRSCLSEAAEGKRAGCGGRDQKCRVEGGKDGRKDR